MNLFQLNQQILECIDLDTGEILDAERLHDLQMEKREKRRNYVFAIFNLDAMAHACREQEMRFKHRREQAEKSIAWLKDTLKADLNGQKMKEDEFSVSYRKSEAVEIEDIHKIPQRFLKQAEPTADKNAIKLAIKHGDSVDGAKIVERESMVIK